MIPSPNIKVRAERVPSEFTHADPYGRSGPYGEVLGWALGALKTRIVHKIIGHLSQLPDSAGVIDCFMESASMMLSDQARQLSLDREALRESLVNVWPGYPEIDREEIPQLANQRLEQLLEYLEFCLNSIRSFLELEPVKRSHESLARVIGLLFWPYYFVTLPREAGNTPSLITWMPPRMMMTSPCPGLWSNSHVEPPFSLYPSVYELFASSPSTGRELLSDLAISWLDLGYSSHFGDSVKDDRNIGHIQSYWSLSEDYEYHESLEHHVTSNGRQSTLFSDRFYLNVSALYIDDKFLSLSDKPTGRLVLCSPAVGLISAIAELFGPTIGESTKTVFASTTIEIWKQVRGSQLSEQLRRRYLKTISDLLEEQRDLDEERFQSFIAHTVLGPLAAILFS